MMCVNLSLTRLGSTICEFAFWTLVHEGDEIGHGDGREPLYMAKELRAIRERTQ